MKYEKYRLSSNRTVQLFVNKQEILSFFVVLTLLTTVFVHTAESQSRRRARLRDEKEIQIEGVVRRPTLRKVEGYAPRQVKGLRLRVEGAKRAKRITALVCQSSCDPLPNSLVEDGAVEQGASVIVVGKRQKRGVLYVESLVSLDSGEDESEDDSDTDSMPRILYLALLRPDADAQSSASGFATIRLNQDNSAALIAFDYSGLTSPRIAMHIHDSLSGGVLVDLDEITPDSEGIYHWEIQSTAQHTVEEIVGFLNSGQTYINIHSATYPAGELEGTFVRQGLAQ